MYERFYGFDERPFTLLPDPDFLFLDEKHRTALNLLETAIFNRSGFCIISGEIGAGKTTLIRELLNRLDGSINVGLVSNTPPSFGELLQWVMAAYGLPCDTNSPLELHKQFVDYTIQQYAQNRHTLLIIDEAQNLTIPALEELRMLSNVNSDKDLVLQIVLVGQRQLRERLQQPDLAQFAQRISFDYHLQGLTAEETRGYIQHRLRHAGGTEGLFDDAACQAVYRSSNGIPQLINRICDLSLVYGYTLQSARIDAALVNRVIEDRRMGALLDISNPARAMASDTALPESEPDSESAAAEGVAGMETAGPEQIMVSLEETDANARPPASNAIVGAMSHALFRTAPGAQSSGEPVDDSAEADSSDLHTLIVNAEQRGRMRSEHAALWLLLGVGVLTGGTGWLTRDIWSEGMSAKLGVPVQQVASPVRTNKPEISIVREADKQEQVPAAERAAVVKAAAQQQEAALKQGAERLSRASAEAKRLAREQRAAEQRPVRQRADRQALEHKADVERRKIESARKAIEDIEIQRARARQAALASFDTQTPSAYDEDDGDAIVQELIQQEAGMR